MTAARLLLPVVLDLLALLLLARPASADPWFGWGEGLHEDRYDDGDVDDEDLFAPRPLGRSRAPSSGHPGSRGETWLSVVALTNSSSSGRREVAGMAVLGFALDRAAEAKGRVSRDPPPASGSSPSPPPPPARSAPPPISPLLPVTAAVARSAVTAAWRAAGLAPDDSRIDAMVARAHYSGLLPETRLRAMRLVNDRTYSDPSSETSPYYNYAGANLSLEARLTFRLDRLLYADDEPTLERIRMERQEARNRLAARTVELLVGWQRARLRLEGAVAPSAEALEASMRLAEAEIAVDLVTGGWFADWLSRQGEAR